ncbi:helix-turn-helix domain-containing protein [Sinorhizobium meliloti]|uniref:helix-turn-helix domain-containing protein n=1 Tax=Rhizobium meliloti TaxID=382 RepID=UPI000FD2E16E|nr:AraC family transcriptional regulator [Sinorhizobium meliloti]MDW9370846.1 helix-turn-helix domain-containing protein [Sinorhizobium meliloti]MDW9428374.1 helix-turn-helix domain-containing protein [Sinorhizobium meliloti]MDW9433816.1 helix-turn-helix domain-containing protein [Sinorhizobium meliloti]MDW9478028.1 helix-turn-helix domain-containing protein [Sinorhizobium meliloti]MDW9639698.1 helix-turn-helix transcriptional regulator [Sinorhizobium meliloti]
MQQTMKTEDWQLTQPPQDHLKAEWSGGRFETARRGRTGEVEGKIEPHFHLIMVTLNGGAAYHAFRTDDGYRYEGRDAKGMVSFLPAGCRRELILRDVAWEWGAIAIDPAISSPRLANIKSFLVGRDDFIYGMTAQMGGVFHRDGSLDATYGSTMALALSEYLSNRIAGQRQPDASARYTLTRRQLNDTYERIDAMLAAPIAIADLSIPLGISEGHFFRAFRGATGETPLQAISNRRMDHAARLLSETDLQIIEVAAHCGIESPSHFARLFRTRKGHSPSEWRKRSDAGFLRDR